MKNKVYLHYGIALVLFLLIKFLVPETNGLTASGINVLAIFAGTIWLWVFVGTVWPSLLAFAAVVMTGVIAPAALSAVTFGHWSFAFILTAMLLNAALVETGVIHWVSTWFISCKICKNRPWVFITMFLLSAFLMELVLDCTPVTLIYITMIDSICMELGYKKGDRFGKALTAAILWLVVIAYAATPISHPIAVVMLGQLESIGISISFLQYTAIGLPFGILFFVLTIVALRLLCKPDFTKFKAYDPVAKRKEMKPLDAKAKTSVAIFLVVLLMWLLPDALVTVAPAIATYFKGIGGTIPPILGCVALAMIHVDGKPAFDLSQGLYKVSIPTLIFVVGIQVFSNTLADSSTGISEFLGNVFTPIASNVPPTLFIAIAILVSIVLTQFLSNMVVQSLFFYAFVPVILATNASGATGISVAAFGLILSIAVNVSFLFPSSYICAPLCYSSGYLEIKDGVKLGLPMAVVGYLLLFLVFWPLANLIF